MLLNLPSSKISIRTELILIILLFSMTPLLILSFLYYSRVNSLVTENVSTYATGLVNQNADAAENLMKQLYVIWRQVVDIAALTDYLYLPTVDPGTDQNAILKADEIYLKRLKRSFSYISNIYIVGIENRAVSTAIDADFQKLEEKPWFQQARTTEIPGIKLQILVPDYAQRAATKPNRTLTMVSRIAPYGLPQNSIILVIDFDYGLLFGQFDISLARTGSSMMIYDESGFILYHPNRNFLGQETETSHVAKTSRSELLNKVLTNRGDSVLLRRPLEPFGWVVSEMPLQGLQEELSSIQELYLVAVLLLILTTIFMSLIAVNRVTRPLFKIIEGMDTVHKGDFSRPLEEAGCKEFVHLVSSFNSMQVQIDALVNQVVLKERETVRAELLALQFQINPHFLYNTIDVIRGMAYESRYKDVADMTASLGELFRYASSGSGGTATLLQELEHLNHYLEIQKHRFQNRFCYSSDIEEGCSRANVVRFMLQPIVENAFQHGVEKCGKNGHIELKARREGGQLVVTVRDNGPGIDDTTLEKIRIGLNAGRESHNTGIGMANVHNRIRLVHGQPSGIEVESDYGHGTLVTIRQPFFPVENSL